MLLGPNKQKPGRARAGWRNGTRGYQYAVNTHKKAIRHKTTVMALTVMTFLYERKSACRCSSSFAAFSAFLTPYTKHTNHDPQAVKLEVLISLLMLVFPCQEGSTHFATPQRSFLSKEEGVRGGGGVGRGAGQQVRSRTSTPVVPAAHTCTTYNASSDGIQVCALSVLPCTALMDYTATLMHACGKGNQHGAVRQLSKHV